MLVLIFSIPGKNLKWKQSFHTEHSVITYFWIWLIDGAEYQTGDEAEARDTDEQPLSDKPPLIRCGETYSAWQ